MTFSFSTPAALVHRTVRLALASLLVCGASFAQEADREVLVLTSTNATSSNQVLVFHLERGTAPALELKQTLPTGGIGGAGGNAGILQFKDDSGAVANHGSNTVSRLARHGDLIGVEGTIALAPRCVQPNSVALDHDHLFVVGSNCVESHRWPSGGIDGIVTLNDTSAAQVAAGRTWAAVTLKSRSVLQLPLTAEHALSGTSFSIALPSTANNTPLGAAFWDDLLGFEPAHSPDSLAIVNANAEVFPIVGPAPPFPSNAPCWLTKGPGNLWYAGNSPGHAIFIFFSDAQGGSFYKSEPLPGVPTDVSASKDGKWFAVIYSANDNGYVALYSIDRYGGLNLVATSSPVGVGAFNGVAISE